MIITKSDFLNYLKCPSFFWFAKLHPERLSEDKTDPFVKQLIEQGNEVETCARELFPNGVLVQSYGQTSVETTQNLINQGVKYIFQASFLYQNLYIRVDVLERTDQGWNIYEVKATNSQDVKKEVYIADAAFQAFVIKQLGFQIKNVSLIELNKEYVKYGETDFQELLITSPINSEVNEMQELIERSVLDMQKFIKQETEPTECDCYRLTKRNWCRSFHIMYPKLPEYSVHEISRIGEKKFKGLLDNDIIDVMDIPKDYELTVIQRNQVNVAQSEEPIINSKGIRRELNKIQFPLYFLYYETFGAAIPVYDGCAPYNQVPFQFSLHFKESSTSDYEHIEYLHTDSSSPIKAIAEKLCESIGSIGSIITWNDSFEAKCNELLARIHPEYEAQLQSINDRLYDLQDVFSKQYHVDKGFRGKTSIKKVLPVICPELSYNQLDIGDGGTATSKFKEMIWGNIDDKERKKIANDLLEYCKLDTWAMVRIWEELKMCI